jgi:hypothetical protein
VICFAGERERCYYLTDEILARWVRNLPQRHKGPKFFCFDFVSWKGLDWETMDRLYQKGYIGDPGGKAASVVLTEAGEKLSKELFFKHFGVKKECD